MSRTKELHPNPASLALYLRTRAGLTQAQVQRMAGLNQSDVSRFERGCTRMAIGKAKRIARVFGVSVNDLVKNNYASVLPNIKAEPIRNPCAQARFREHQIQALDTGAAGEAFVAALEREKLKDTPFANGVNEAYADDPTAGFDVMSFTPDGDIRFIEVKSTVGELDEPFFITAVELRFLEQCARDGMNYELYRVYHLMDSTTADYTVYTAQELLESFDFCISEYTVRRMSE